MTSSTVARYHAALNLQTMDDANRQTLVAAIQKNSATSAILANNQSVGISLAALVAKALLLATSGQNVGTLMTQLKAAITTLGESRNDYDLEITALKTLVENYAKTAADITGMGFTLLSIVRNSKTVPDAPAAVNVKTSKSHGKASATVVGKGHLGTFAAQATIDPLTPASVWFALPGTGKQRKLAYPTGTKVWVQFAQVRYGLQGPWSTPVLVTMP